MLCGIICGHGLIEEISLKNVARKLESKTAAAAFFALETGTRPFETNRGSYEWRR